MAKFYWKGTAAGFTTDVTGASYDSWIAATNAGLTKNWANSVGTIGSGVTGATLLPGVNDLVYISDRFPTLGSTLSSIIGASSFTYVLSPCLNSSNVGITASYCYIGPWSNQATQALPITSSGRVGGNVLGNSSVSETSGVTGATLVGYPLELRVTNGMFVYDNDLGAFNLHLNFKAGTSYGVFTAQRVIPHTGQTAASAFSIADKPWKLFTDMTLDGANSQASLVRIEFKEGIVLNSVKILQKMQPYTTSAIPQMLSRSQIFNFIIEKADNKHAYLRHIDVQPMLRCFDAPMNKYEFRSSVLRLGATTTLSPQNSTEYADLLLRSALRATGISTGTIPYYDVVMGSDPSEDSSTVTVYKFATVGAQEGSPNIKLKGALTPIYDFYMPVGRLDIDPTSVSKLQDIYFHNGLITSIRGADLGGTIRLSPIDDETTESSTSSLSGATFMHIPSFQQITNWGQLGNSVIGGATYSPAISLMGLRIKENAVGNVKFPISHSYETHLDVPYAQVVELLL